MCSYKLFVGNSHNNKTEIFVEEWHWIFFVYYYVLLVKHFKPVPTYEKLSLIIYIKALQNSW